MAETSLPPPPSYNEAISQAKLSDLTIEQHYTIVSNAQINDDISITPTTYAYTLEDRRINHKTGRKVTVGNVVLIGLLLIFSPYCACKAIKEIKQTNPPNNRKRGGYVQSYNTTPTERQQERGGERRIERLKRKIERKKEKMERRQGNTKKIEKYQRKIQKWENKIEQRQAMMNSRCGPNTSRCNRC